MFTGIVAALGTVTDVTPAAASARLTVRGDVVAGCVAGDSVAVSGVCLTVTAIEDDAFTADVVAETLSRTTLGELVAGDPVNLELAATPTTRLGGHLVQGHVDGVGRIVARVPGDAWELVTVRIPSPLMRYVVEKGSVAVDGVSLTVASLDGDTVTVSLIPETLRRTTLGVKDVGTAVNIEVDVLAKHVERLLVARTEH
jgi:riboflavin synthase